MAGPKTKPKTDQSKEDKKTAEELFERVTTPNAATVALFSAHIKTWHPEITELPGERAERSSLPRPDPSSLMLMAVNVRRICVSLGATKARRPSQYVFEG